MSNPKIDEDTVAALRLMRIAMAGGYRIGPEVRAALRALDNADLFTEVDLYADERGLDAGI